MRGQRTAGPHHRGEMSDDDAADDAPEPIPYGEYVAPGSFLSKRSLIRAPPTRSLPKLAASVL